MNGASNGVWRKNPALAWREIDDDTIIISPSESVMHELNETGSFLWSRIDGRRSAAELADLLTENFDVAPETALEDTTAILTELSLRKLLVPAEEE
jgi:hypothetical protein